MGYDVHRLQAGCKLIMGGVEIPYEKGLLGHSDADVLVHAVMDALLEQQHSAISVSIFRIRIPPIRGNQQHSAFAESRGAAGRALLSN